MNFEESDSLMKSRELLIVLGRPGSGCSMLLKTICRDELHGLCVEDKSAITYNGIPRKQMLEEFRGEVVYNEEMDRHFPHPTVGQTLEMAAAYRTPAVRVAGYSRQEVIEEATRVAMVPSSSTRRRHSRTKGNFYLDDIEIKGEPRRLLDHVSVWDKPGTLTAMVGVSGAGKMTLLDVLARRTSTGVVCWSTGSLSIQAFSGKLDTFSNKVPATPPPPPPPPPPTVPQSPPVAPSSPLGARHAPCLPTDGEHTCTQRLPPCARSLLQRNAPPTREKCVNMLNIGGFAEAVVGVPGQSLIVKQRKLLIIDVELAAKPKLLLFLDESTRQVPRL